MLEAVLGSLLATFMYDNAEFFHVKQKQEKAGYQWVYKPKERNLSIPGIGLKNPSTGKEGVIWVLE